MEPPKNLIFPRKCEDPNADGDYAGLVQLSDQLSAS
jgi:hypothetical protein